MTGRARRIARKWGLLFLALSALVLSFRALPESRHPAVGRWRAANFEIVVGPELVASIQGVPCDWALMDTKTITVSPRATLWSPELNATIDAPFVFETIEDGRYALVDFVGFPLALERADRDAAATD